MVYSGLRKYTSHPFRVSLQYPAGWQPLPGYEERYSGTEGFFALSAINGEGLTMDEICQLESEHHLRPYGTQPTIERLQVQGQKARLIWPSEDQAENMRDQAALIIQHPRPVEISGHVYRYFVLWADKDHMQQLANTLKFALSAYWFGPTTTFTDAALGIAFDIPAEWMVDSQQDTAAHFTLQDTMTSAIQGMFTFSVLSPESTTLNLALDEVLRGAWGPYVRNVRSVHLGEFEVMRLELMPGEERPPAVWLSVSPSGRAVGFIPYAAEPALVEAALDTLRTVSSKSNS